MASRIEGKLRADGLRFDIVLSRFNDLYGEKLLAGCLDCLERHGADPASIRVVRVPGAWEMPQAARKLTEAGGADALVALGVLIRGETPHFDHISAAVTRELAAIGSQTGIPLAYGLLTCDNADQAAARSGSKAGNKGWEAALAAIEMADLSRQLARPARRGR